MPLKQQLVDRPPRDRSGSLASDRFEFQKNWALCELMMLHISGADYVVSFDHHEDVTFLNSETEPTEIRACQVKSQNGVWTLDALLKRKEGKTEPLPSVLGKLCSALVYFPESVKLLEVVATSSFSVHLEPDGKIQRGLKNVQFSEIAKAKRDEIIKQMKEELALPSEPLLDGKLRFQVSDLSLDDHAAHTRGKLVDMLEQLYPGKAFRIPVIYRAIIGEITARNNNLEEIPDYDAFLRKKSLSKERFAKLLDECGAAKDKVEWSTVESRLNTEQAPLTLLRALKKHWDDVLIERVDRRGDNLHVQMLAEVRKAAEQVKDMPNFVDALTSALKLIKRRPEWNVSDDYLRTCLAVYIYEL